jgi:hypothetical protein
VTVTGPSTEINRIEKVVAEIVLEKSLTSNKSADAEIVLLSDKGRSDFKYITKSIEKVVLTIPVLKVKELETVVAFKNTSDDYYVKADENNFDGLNFLADQPMSEINKKAMQGTILAHVSGGVPNILLEADAMDEENLGYIIYFFEKACAISGYMLGVNPFNQPGVEDYKVNMFALLGKPGYEAHREELLKKLGE